MLFRSVRTVLNTINDLLKQLGGCYLRSNDLIQLINKDIFVCEGETTSNWLSSDYLPKLILVYNRFLEVIFYH